MSENREQFTDSVREKIKDARKDLEELKNKAGDEMRSIYDNIKVGIDEVDNQLENARDVAEDEWEDFKADISEAAGDIRDKLNLYKGGENEYE